MNNDEEIKIDKDKIASKIRSLLEKTMENGCTEQEAISATKKAYEILHRYNMTMDEINLRKSKCDTLKHEDDYMIGSFLEPVAAAITYLLDIRGWKALPGEMPAFTFMGLEHEVKIAGYLMSICSRAMNEAKKSFEKNIFVPKKTMKIRKTKSFLSGMSASLAKRIVEMKTEPTTNSETREKMFDEHMNQINIKTKESSRRAKLYEDEAFEKGKKEGEKIQLQIGVENSSDHLQLIKNENQRGETL